MSQSPLVTTAWLEEHLADRSLRIIEVCSLNDDKTYRSGHIPGALWLYWKGACWHETDRDFITPEAMAKMFGAMGIGPQSTLVLYGDPVQFGSYAFWAFTMAGHKELRLLDGGRKKWVVEKRPLAQDVAHYPAVDYPPPGPGPVSMRIGRDNVREHLREPSRLLLDLRSPEEYSGERVSDYSFKFDHGAERTGRIPGAVHLYFRDLLNDDDSFKSRDQLAPMLAARGIAPDKFDEVVCYCRLSHRATIGWLALKEILGHKDVKIYDGSWTEWGSIVGFPIER
jgi:thiosulfate/3-mercaptopyruvate sulfurtransferase